MQNMFTAKPTPMADIAEKGPGVTTWISLEPIGFAGYLSDYSDHKGESSDDEGDADDKYDEIPQGQGRSHLPTVPPLKH